MTNRSRGTVRVNQIKPNQTVAAKSSVRKGKKARAPKLRKSLTPGTVVIPLTGQFRGKHVVMLKQLSKSGMLLCTGPYKLNGVPLRRMNARMVIATSTKVDVSKAVAAAEKIDDAFFARNQKKGLQNKEDFASKDAKAGPSAARKQAQAAVDSAILAGIKDPIMKKYLGSKFALSNSDKPHQMKF